MAMKEVIIDGRKMMYGTSAKASPETNVSSTSTFDGAITQGTNNIAWSVELSKMRFEGLTSHRELSRILDDMLVNPKMVTIRETVSTKEEVYTIVDNFFGCILDGNDYELKPDDNTAENIKFKASSRERKYE